MAGQKVDETPEGTFAVPRYCLPTNSPVYGDVQKLFRRIKWDKPPKRADAIKNRFNAFTSLLWAVKTDERGIVHTDLNKSSYDVKKWPIPYDPMTQTVKALVAMGWLKPYGERARNRQLRYKAYAKSPMRRFPTFKVSQL